MLTVTGCDIIYDVPDCANMLNITTTRVRMLIKEGKLKAVWFGPVHAITDRDLAAFVATRRGPGRAKQVKPENV